MEVFGQRVDTGGNHMSWEHQQDHVQVAVRWKTRQRSHIRWLPGLSTHESWLSPLLLDLLGVYLYYFMVYSHYYSYQKPNPVMVRPSCLHATLRFLLHDDFPIFLHVAFLLLVACAPKLGLPLQIQVFPQNISLSKKFCIQNRLPPQNRPTPQQPTSFNFFPHHH